MSKTFKQVDVFTDKRFKGNPLAVFFDSDDLSDDEMQTIATWTNLSETTFVTKPTVEKADYQVKIFTTASELPFAGHPTIGTCYALLELRLVKPNSNGKIYQQCLGGLVELSIQNYNPDKISDVYISFELPYYKIAPFPISSEEIAKALNILPLAITSTPIVVDDGPIWATVEIESGELVRDCKPNLDAIYELSEKYGWEGVGMFGKYANGEYELRNFCPDCDEDPACGSGAGAVGVYLGHHLNQDISTLTLNQGVNLGRLAKLTVSVIRQENTDPIITVGGQTITIIDGKY